jgi:predicted O-methyltransferase YrrM
MSGNLASRLASVDRILADPPVVHPMDWSASPRMGVWSTDEAAYRFLAKRCLPGTRTIETGSGLSTVLFAALGTDHICCTPGPEEKERILEYCKAHGLPTDGLRFELASSHESLPRLQRAGTRIDLALIDGGHGFPLPVLDWFYAGGMLEAGGVVVIDDVALPAVATLLDFVGRDPRWQRISGSTKWVAYERTTSGPLAEDWTVQPFYVPHNEGLGDVARRVRGRVRRELARIRS